MRLNYAQITHRLRTGAVLASIIPHKGRWRALVFKGGARKSKVFDSKRAAQDWANQAEYEGKNRIEVVGRHTVGEAFDLYARTVSPAKRGARWETIRLEKFQRDKLAALRVSEVTAPDIADWRDRRLREVKGASVRREMQLMSSVFNIARKEWKWISDSPMVDVRKPPQSPRRNRLVTDEELEALALSAGPDPANATARAFMAFRFSIETGMRAGEVIGLEWSRVDLGRRVAHLPKTKNGESRDVPLSLVAVSILEGLTGDPVFGISSASLDALWRKLRDRAGVDGLTYHDSRHVAITRLAKKIEVLDLARVVGHRDIRMLLTYYEADAEALATQLD